MYSSEDEKKKSTREQCREIATDVAIYGGAVVTTANAYNAFHPTVSTRKDANGNTLDATTTPSPAGKAVGAVAGGIASMFGFGGTASSVPAVAGATAAGSGAAAAGAGATAAGAGAAGTSAAGGGVIATLATATGLSAAAVTGGLALGVIGAGYWLFGGSSESEEQKRRNQPN